MCEVHSVLKENKLPVPATVQLRCAHGHSHLQLFLSPQLFSCQCAPSLIPLGHWDRPAASLVKLITSGIGGPPSRYPFTFETHRNSRRHARKQVNCVCSKTGNIHGGCNTILRQPGVITVMPAQRHSSAAILQLALACLSFHCPVTSSEHI